MDSVTYTIPGSSPSFSASIPAGPERTIELYAPVDWDATVAPETDKPKLVKAYGAKSTLDLSAGKTVNVALRLEVAETKILLPDTNLYYMQVADSLHPITELTPTNYPTSSNSDYEFDRYGRLIFSSGNVYNVANESVVDIVPFLLTGLNGHMLAYDRGRDILYSSYFTGLVYNLFSYSYASATPSAVIITPPLGYTFSALGVAVDSNGYVYALLQHTSTTIKGLSKLSIGSPSGGTSSSTVIQFSSLESLGVGDPLSIRDMTVKDNSLYLLAGENAYFSVPHRGKLVEIDLISLERSRELGWSASDYPSSPTEQFYGPQRFIALAPRKLIIADEGYDGASDIDRVVEVDITAWAFSDLSAEGISSFFYSYFC
jgi:hypothetical protein